MSGACWVSYDFAVLRVVPRVHLGAFVNVGVLVHARAAGFLGARILVDPASLRARVAGIDAELLSRYLHSLHRVVDGDPAAGPVALASPSERFHWLVAPRSDVLQCSPVHEGVCADPAEALAELFAGYVGEQGPT